MSTDSRGSLEANPISRLTAIAVTCSKDITEFEDESDVALHPPRMFSTGGSATDVFEHNLVLGVERFGKNGPVLPISLLQPVSFFGA